MLLVNPRELLVGMQNGAVATDKVWSFLKTLTMDLPCDPLISHLGVHPPKNGK